MGGQHPGAYLHNGLVPFTRRIALPLLAPSRYWLPSKQKATHFFLITMLGYATPPPSLSAGRRCRRCVHYTCLSIGWLLLSAAGVYGLVFPNAVVEPRRRHNPIYAAIVTAVALRLYLTLLLPRYLVSPTKQVRFRRLQARRTHAWFYVNVAGELIENLAYIVFARHFLTEVPLVIEGQLSTPLQVWCFYGAIAYANNVFKEIVNLYARHPSLKAPAACCTCLVTSLGALSVTTFVIVGIGGWFAGLTVPSTVEEVSATTATLVSFAVMSACQVFWLLRSVFHTCRVLQTTS